MNKNIVEFPNLIDEEGRIIRWPKKAEEKLFILKYLSTKFELNSKYTELEVNRIISRWHLFNDHALLRRELFNKYLINRTPDCKEYWVNTIKCDD